MLPAAVTLTVIGVLAGVFSSGFCTPGSRTCAPACIAGMMTMKMMSRTSTTSTRGVTLMSGLARSGLRTEPLPLESARRMTGRGLLVLQVIDELAPRLVEREEQPVGAGVEEVEGQHRRDRDHQAERGDDEGLGDAGRDRAETARALGGDALERGDDADDRAEEADEGRDRSHGGEHAHAAAEIGRHRLRLALELAARELHRRELPRLRDAGQVGLDSGAEQTGEVAAAVLLGGRE